MELCEFYRVGLCDKIDFLCMLGINVFYYDCENFLIELMLIVYV